MASASNSKRTKLDPSVELKEIEDACNYLADGLEFLKKDSIEENAEINYLKSFLLEKSRTKRDMITFFNNESQINGTIVAYYAGNDVFDGFFIVRCGYNTSHNYVPKHFFKGHDSYFVKIDINYSSLRNGLNPGASFRFRWESRYFQEIVSQLEDMIYVKSALKMKDSKDISINILKSFVWYFNCLSLVREVLRNDKVGDFQQKHLETVRSVYNNLNEKEGPWLMFITFSHSSTKYTNELAIEHIKTMKATTMQVYSLIARENANPFEVYRAEFLKLKPNSFDPEELVSDKCMAEPKFNVNDETRRYSMHDKYGNKITVGLFYKDEEEEEETGTATLFASTNSNSMFDRCTKL